MKNNKKRIGLIVVLVVLLIALIAGFTYSKYVYSKTFSSSDTIAAWAFTGDLQNSSSTSVTSLADTITATETDVADGVLAPGTSGSFSIVVDGTGSQVGVDYTVAVSETEDSPTNLYFQYYDEESDTTYTEYSLKSLFSSINGTADGIISGTLSANTSKTYTITWNWPYETDDGNGDDADMADAGSTYSFGVDITGTQHKTN